MEVLDESITPNLKIRRSLLPTWIKIFLWIFMVFSLLVPIGLVLGLFGISFSLAMYGLETNNSLSLMGLAISVLFAIKGAVSFGLWMEKNWAVKLAVVDAIVGIVICAIMMVLVPLVEPGFSVNIRLELIALIPYLRFMKKIEVQWDSNIERSSTN